MEYPGSDVVKAASERLEEIRKSLPDSTRGMMEFCMMLYLIKSGIPRFMDYATSPQFLEHFATWAMLGAPEYHADTNDLLVEFAGKWVN